MNRPHLKPLLLTLVASCLVPAGFLHADSLVAPAARVAIVGDSITEQKLYSKFLECYLLACSGVPDVKVMQFGWSGERADGFANRASNDLGTFKPTVVTLCYGMNDGGYQPWKPEIGAGYEKNMRNVLAKLDHLGVKSVVVGSPGAVDTNFFRPGQKMGEQPAHVAYNDTLAHLRDIDRKLAEEKHQRFADVHAAMVDAMKKANETRGPKYDVCGGDGFHPGPNGQLLMAYAFLKGLGVDGTIGEIAIDLNGGQGTTTRPSTGHAVVRESRDDGRTTIELESTRWPFCFEGDGTSSSSTRSILPFVAFNQDLNRFTLKVAGLKTAKAKVTWGNESREFTKEQLAAGINLPAEFTKTPFDESFARLQGAVAAKQGFETFMIKQIVTDFRNIPDIGTDKDVQEAADTLTRKLMNRWEQLDKAAHDQLTPVKHTLLVESLQ
jgi:lysophospholipase L1-like esterase